MNIIYLMRKLVLILLLGITGITSAGTPTDTLVVSFLLNNKFSTCKANFSLVLRKLFFNLFRNGVLVLLQPVL